MFALAVLAAASAAADERTPKEIQEALINKGFNPGAADGLWGKKSAKALRDFQLSHGLAATGKVDDATTSALFPEYPGLESSKSKPITEPVGEQTTPEARLLPVAETTTDQKTNRVSSETMEAKESTQDPVETHIKPEAVTLTPALDAGTNDSSPPSADDGELRGIYVIAAVILGAFIFARRRKKAKAKAEWSPSQIDLAATENTRDSYRGDSPASGERGDSSDGTPLPRRPDHTLSPAKPIPAIRFEQDNAAKRRPPVFPPSNDILSPIEERPTASPTNRTTLTAHAASVKQWVIDNAEASRKRYDEAQRQHFDTRGDPPATSVSSNGWREQGSEVIVAGIKISKGLIYVGKSLDKQGRRHEAENCLINPDLRVAQWGDREGRTMGYWPSYSSITPEARRTYLDWLAGDRSDPSAYIGYVFLYFYGLERRLVLERSTSDAAVVAAEVKRLLDVYGSNHSFNRYATELLTAVELKSGEPSAQFLARVEPNGYEVPTAIKIALGVRVRDDRAMEPDLLYRFAVTHPETRARTPARRAPELMRQLFAQQMLAEYPSGFRYKAARAKPLQKHYKACSGSFEVDIDVLGGNIPNIAHHSQPIGVARRIFDACSDALDDYSRTLGRLPGLTPNLMAVSKLPKPLRMQQAGLLEGNPLDQFAILSRDAAITTVEDVARIAGVDIGTPPTKPKLREVSQLLAAFGFGVTFDPGFATKTLGWNDPALVFPIDAEAIAEPSDRFRHVQLAVMLGLIIGHADGHFDERERDALIQRIEREPSLTSDERNRLRAEVRVNEVYPDRLEDWMKRLKDVSPHSKMSVADELICVASADGNLHAAEVRKLELIFKRMGLGNQVLYDRLHAGSNSPIGAADRTSVTTQDGSSSDKPTTRIDLSRLQSIRSETSVTANVLADIFADDDPTIFEPVVAGIESSLSEGDSFEGLEQRYGALLNDLCLRSSWSAADFEHLARDAGLMPGAAREAVNDWAMDRFDELLIEGEDPVEINLHLIPSPEVAISTATMEGISA